MFESVLRLYLLLKLQYSTTWKTRNKHTLFPSLPKEIIFAVKSALSRKTFLCQITFALAALHALDVPGSVQHIEQKPVQNRPLAAGAVDHGFGWANNPTDEARTLSHANTINSTGRALTGYVLPPFPESPGAPGSIRAEKSVDQVSPRISPCMRKKKCSGSKNK